MAINVPAGPSLPQTRCRLFRLPAELRNYVYELVLTVEPDTRGEVDVVFKDSTAAGPLTVLTMLGTCRLIYEEAVGIFYNQHRICMRLCMSPYLDFYYYHPFINGFVQSLSNQRANCIRTLTLSCKSMELATAVCKRARYLPRLQNLTVRLEKRGAGDWWMEESKRDFVFLKRAVRKLVVVERLGFELLHIYDEEERKVLEGMMGEVVKSLPAEVRRREVEAAAALEAAASLES